MAITAVGTIIETALWPQGDIRDPLGVWGSRLGVTGDASGGPISTTVRVAPQNVSAYVYTCYSATIAKLDGTGSGAECSVRLLTNWPNVDPQAGVQAYGSFKVVEMLSFGAGVPLAAPKRPLIDAADRFVLLWTPRAGSVDVDILALNLDENVDGDPYSFEAYGYFWDRSVMEAPGGLRHPGAS